MSQGVLKVIVGLATVTAWATFLYLDSLWSACLSRAVEAGNKTFGEIYGPLSFFRPLTMYAALALSLLSVVFLVVGSNNGKH